MDPEALRRERQREALGLDAIEEPPEFRCPITLVQMVDPVIAADGFTYERAAISRWINQTPYPWLALSPTTGRSLEGGMLVPNRTLRALIRDHEKYVHSQMVQVALTRDGARQRSREQKDVQMGVLQREVTRLEQELVSLEHQCQERRASERAAATAVASGPTHHARRRVFKVSSKFMCPEHHDETATTSSSTADSPARHLNPHLQVTVEAAAKAVAAASAPPPPPPRLSPTSTSTSAAPTATSAAPILASRRAGQRIRQTELEQIRQMVATQATPPDGWRHHSSEDVWTSQDRPGPPIESSSRVGMRGESSTSTLQAAPPTPCPTPSAGRTLTTASVHPAPRGQSTIAAAAAAAASTAAAPSTATAAVSASSEPTSAVRRPGALLTRLEHEQIRGMRTRQHVGPSGRVSSAHPPLGTHARVEEVAAL